MTLHIIHLAHRTDRHATLMEQLASQGITDYRIWEGIMDKELPRRGVSQAHKQIVRHARQLGLPEVTIAEDDIRFTDAGAWEFYLSRKPAAFDLYLGGIYYGTPDGNNEVKDFSALTLYTVHSRFYDTLLSVPEDGHLDRKMANLGKYVVCNPMVVTQHVGYSDNVQKEVDWSQYLEGRALYRRM